MKIRGRFTIKGSDDPKEGFLEWVKSNFEVTENSSGLRFEVDSDSPFAHEFALRISDSFDVLPLTFWHIEYSKSDIASAELLHLWCDVYIADLANPPNTELIELASTKALKVPRPIGAVRPFGSVVAVNSTLKERLNLAGLKGLKWVELHARNERREYQSIWKMSSSVALPESPIPLTQSYGDPFDGNYEKGCLYRSPYREVEIAYNAQNIEEMVGFDVALTRENIGNYPGGCFQSVIVSQAFRRHLEIEKVTGVKYTPVRLLQSGDSAVRDPFDALASNCNGSLT